MSSITVDDILNDLALIQQASSSSSSSSNLTAAHTSARHPLLHLGQSLLPDSLLKSSSSQTSLSSSSEDLESVFSALEGESSAKRQTAALHLSKMYLDITGETMALDPSRKASSNLERQSSEMFDDLHRRVASLQAFNESSLSKVQEIRQIIESSNELTVNA